MSNDVVARMMRFGNMMSLSSVPCYLASTSDQLFIVVHNRFQKLLDEVNEFSSAPDASNSDALGIPTNEKGGAPVSSERSKGDDAHSRNVEHIKHVISVADKSPIIMQHTLGNSSDQGKGPCY